MIWAAINSFASLCVVILASYLLGAHGHRFNWLERVGTGLAGAGSIMTIGPILTKSAIIGISPYDDWSGCLLRFGLAVFLTGVVARLEGYAPAPRLAP